MSIWIEFAKDVMQTAFRLLPWPTTPGLRSVGHPGPESPVLVTSNYDLTLRRLMRAVRNLDAWIVVAPAQGINVWCAAAGGHLTTHQIVTALKTSGVAESVTHREVILPQLAATGIEGLGVYRRAGWRVRFGPVRAEDLPAYLSAGREKTDAMRTVRFGVRERIEMAAVWAAPVSLFVGGFSALVRPSWALPFVGLITVLSLAVFLFYDRIPGPRRALLATAAMLVSLAAVHSVGGSGAAFIAAIVAPALLTAILTFDYSGSTPNEGGSHFDGQDWKITLDLDRCVGIYRCWEVCPEACFEKLEERKRIVLADEDRCVRCGACVVQCPTDALFFSDGAGDRIEPDTIRRFKLNLLGRRAIATGEPEPRDAVDAKNI